MSNHYLYNQQNQHLSTSSHRMKNENQRRGAFDFINHDAKKSSPKGEFDLSTWIQHGSLCRNSCYGQLRDEALKQRTTSFSSSCYSTEDNSSLNDSFEDLYDVKYDPCFDNSNWLQGYQGKFIREGWSTAYSSHLVLGL